MKKNLKKDSLIRYSRQIVLKNVGIVGQKKLYGAQCISSDLRSSFAIILGSIAAIGSSKVQRVYHNFRGYYQLPKKLKKLGINIKVIN